MGSYVFGDYELDGLCFELRQRGQRVTIQPKEFRLLLYLVRHRDRVVSDDELFAALWPGETVCRGSLRRAVYGARRVLGDDGDNQSSIRTVRGHGYRFLLPVACRHASVHAAASEARLGAIEEEREESAPHTSGGGQDAFVGRAFVMRALEQHLEATLRGEGRFVLLVGEPGIGKTRTILELSRRAALRGAECWFARCIEEGGAPPFWPWTQVVREGLRARGADELRRLMGHGGADIAEAVGELHQLLPDLARPPRIGSAEARFRFFDSTLGFLQRAGARRPLLVIFDDLQRADHDSLRLLAFVAGQLGSAPVLMVGTARRAARGERALHGLMPSLLREDLSHCIELTGFTPPELATYLELATGNRPPPEVVQALHERTAGNPLLFRQLVRGSKLAEPALPNWEALLQTPRSADLQSAIERHLQTLPESCQELLRSATVFGREFRLANVAELLGRSPETLLSALTDPLELGLLQPSDDAVGSYRFTHAVIRDALYAQLSPEERSLLHARAACLLEARHPIPSDTLLAEIAEHFALAAPTHDQGRALEYAMRTAALAVERLAYEEAAQLLQRALSLLELGKNDPRVRARLRLTRGEALMNAGQLGDARAELLQAAQLARELDDVEVLAGAAALFASPPEDGCEDELQIALLKSALERLAEDDARRPELLALLAKSLCFSRDREEQAALARRARAAAGALAPNARAAVLQRCHEALSEPDQLQTRLAIGTELLDLAHELGDPRILLKACLNQVEDRLELGDLRSVDQAMHTYDVLAQRVREPFHRWRAKCYRSVRALVRGDLAAAELFAQEALELGAVVGRAHAEHIFCVQMGAVMRLQGRAREFYELVRSVVCRMPQLVGWQAVLGVLEVDLGEKEAAQQSLARVMALDPTPTFHDPFRLGVLAPMAELSDSLGDRKAAARVYELLLPYAECCGIMYFGVGTHGPIARHLGMLAARLGDLALASRHFERALEIAEAMPSDTWICATAYYYARALLALGAQARRAEASALVARSFAIASARGFHSLDRACRQAVAHHRLRLPGTLATLA